MHLPLTRYNGWALITGASTGLGKAFAQQCAAAGVNCVLVALEADLLAALAEELEQAATNWLKAVESFDRDRAARGELELDPEERQRLCALGYVE